ncbi:MAG: phosphate acyltransferase PlsX [Vampirovibrionales bacterium]
MSTPVNESPFQQTPMSSTPLPAVVIAIDAMGGDYAPEAIVEGGVLAAKELQVGIQLVGPTERVIQELKKHTIEGLPIVVVEAPDTIEMDESPLQALKKKKHASIAVTARLVKEGVAQGMVAAGSTGVAMAAALFGIGRIEGVERPAIGVVMPNWTSPLVMIDGGANADCRPELLVQFAHMGQAYMKGVYKLQAPKIGLLNIGTEEGKGNAFVKEAYDVLQHQTDLNFIGNVEGRHLFLGGCDVAVTDGFSGNVAIKAAEGMATLMMRRLKRELTASFWNKLVAVLVKPILKKALKPVDHEEVGGSLLLGVKGICVIAHGSSSARAIVNAVRVAKQGIEGRVVEQLTQQLAEAKADTHVSQASSSSSLPRF